jgi:hypothetical protein
MFSEYITEYREMAEQMLGFGCCRLHYVFCSQPERALYERGPPYRPAIMTLAKMPNKITPMMYRSVM